MLIEGKQLQICVSKLTVFLQRERKVFVNLFFIGELRWGIISYIIFINLIPNQQSLFLKCLYKSYLYFNTHIYNKMPCINYHNLFIVFFFCFVLNTVLNSSDNLTLSKICIPSYNCQCNRTCFFLNSQKLKDYNHYKSQA